MKFIVYQTSKYYYAGIIIYAIALSATLGFILFNKKILSIGDIISGIAGIVLFGIGLFGNFPKTKDLNKLMINGKTITFILLSGLPGSILGISSTLLAFLIQKKGSFLLQSWSSFLMAFVILTITIGTFRYLKFIK